MKKIIIALAILLVVSGCAQQPAAQTGGQATVTQNVQGVVPAEKESGNMNTVETNDTVKVEYVGTFTDGNIFDKSEGRGPLEFTVGAGQMIKGFDEAVVGMKLNDENNVTIPPEKAYGTDADAQQVAVPISQIQSDGNVAVGTVLYTSTGMPATIIDINGDTATVEIKHPLAGKTLNFWIKVVSITKAGQ